MKKSILSLFVFFFVLNCWGQTNVTPKSVTPISAKNAKSGDTAPSKEDVGAKNPENVTFQGTPSQEYVIGSSQAEAPIPSTSQTSGSTSVTPSSEKNLSTTLFSNKGNSVTPKGTEMLPTSSQGRPNPNDRKKMALPNDIKEPDDAGVIMLVRLVELSAVAMTNPFEIRVQPTVATVDTEIYVGGIIHGDVAEKDAAIINGNVYSTDEFVLGFRIYSIREKNVILEYKDKLLIVPRDKTIIIRLPQQI